MNEIVSMAAALILAIGFCKAEFLSTPHEKSIINKTSSTLLRMPLSITWDRRGT